MALIDVVKWSGTPDLLAWRYPQSNLTTFTQLIVNESQEAVFFHKGKLLQKFGPGKHTLSTENIPLLHELYGLPFGGENPFMAEIWFVNKVFVLDVKWGTQQPFLVRDPEFGIIVPVRGFGQFGIRIGDAEHFLVKLVGTLPGFEKERLVDYFRGLLLSRATSTIVKTIQREKMCVLDIAAHIAELSEMLQESMREEFGEYGVELANFYVSQVSVPEDDPSVAALRTTLSQRADMDIRQYNYQQGRSFDVLDKAAQNDGAAGTIMGAGMGVGMGFGVGGAIGGMMNEVGNQTLAAQPMEPRRSCVRCGAALSSDARFCPACGQSGRENAPAAQVARCDQCGKPIPDGSKFCPSCGDRYNPCPTCRADVPQGAAACPVCGGNMPVICRCGTGVAPEAHFCPGCGKPMRKICSGCGAQIASGQLFCPKCGVKVE